METPAKRPDRRVIKTKRAIRNAFAQLVSQKDITSITIKDIADAADINRKTFYNYYSGVYQIVDEIEDEIISACARVLKDMDFTYALQNPAVIFTKLVAGVNKDMEFYSHLFKTGSDSRLTSKIVTVLKAKIKERFAIQIAVEPAKLDLMADYVITGAMTVFQNWFSSKQDVPMEQYADWLSMLIARGVAGLLDDTASGADIGLL